MVIGVSVCDVTAENDNSSWSAKDFSACVRACWKQYDRNTCGMECKNSDLRPELIAACEKHCFDSNTACVKDCVLSQ